MTTPRPFHRVEQPLSANAVLDRRAFLRHAGAAAVALPVFGAACAEPLLPGVFVGFSTDTTVSRSAFPN